MVLKLSKIGTGDLNKRIILKKRTKTQNNFGEEISVYTTLGTVWAAIEKEKPSEDEEYDHMEQVKSNYIFYIRYIDVSKMGNVFVSYRRKLYEILEADNMNEQNIIIKLITKHWNTDGDENG